MKRTWGAIRKTVIAIVGVIVVIIGIILMPLPGPGLLIVLAGLLILATEFEWARRHRDNLKSHIDTVIKKAKNKQK